MFEFAKNKFTANNNTSSRPPQIITDLSYSLAENLTTLKKLFSNSTDLLTREIDVCGIKVAAIMCEGMVNSQVYAQLIATPLTTLKLENATSDTLSAWVRHKAIFSTDQKELTTFNELFAFIMSGFVVILIDEINHGTACGLQGYQFRSVGEPSSETNIRGSREGFVEPIRINQSLIRRRIKSPTLKFELFPIGDKSKTDISLVYLTDTVSPKLLNEVKHRLSKVSPDVILNAGYIQPFLEYGPPSLFSNVSVTERPDTLCAKINEGRIGILVDGTPFALIVPYFFNEHFQSMDDYAYRPYFATFIRFLKYAAFFISFLLPGLYVAVVTYHPSLLPPVLLMNIAVAEQSAPFPLFIEALLIHLVYEVMREAGLRLPKGIGHAVGIVGGLVIGDAAVTSGLIGAPMVMVVALTAISAFVVPSLYENVATLKFLFIFIGAALGLFGIWIGIAVVLINICAVNAYGVPFSAPISPFSFYAMRDVLFRASWTKLGKNAVHVQDFPGSDIKFKEADSDG